MRTPDPRTFHIAPLQIEQYREELDALTDRFTAFWASIAYPVRLLTRTRRCSYAPLRQQLQQALTPLEDVRALVPLLMAHDAAGVATMLRQRGAALARVLRPARDGPATLAALQAIAQGQATDAVWAAARDGCQQVSWPWRWRTNYRRAYAVMEEHQPPFAIDHFCVCWPEATMQAEALRSVLQRSFLLPQVVAAPLPPLIQGRYREEATLLTPLTPGAPLLRVLTAYDVRGSWDLLSLRELLMQDIELTLALDVRTLSRTKAQRLTTDAFTLLEGAVYGQHAVKDARSERALAAVQYAMQQLDQQNLHEVALSVLLQAPTRAALERQTQTLRDLLGARLRLDVLAGSQAAHLRLFTTQPAQAVTAPLVRRNALSEHVAVKTPWGLRKTQTLRGVNWGYDPFAGMPIHHDLFGVAGTDNAHLLMLGKSGAGKTVALATLALRHAVAGHQVIMLDPVGHVRRLTDAVGGGAACSTLTADAAVNILDPLTTDLVRYEGQVLRKLALILGQVVDHGSGIRVLPRVFSNAERGALDEALQAPTLAGPDGCRLPTLTPATAPLLHDLVAALAAGIPEGHALAREIELLALRSRAHLFNARTTLHWDFQHDVTGYDLRGVDKSLLPLYLDQAFAALNAYVRDPARLARGQKLLCVIDEFGVLSQVESLKAEVAYDTKEWRNYGAALWSADQNAATYMGGSGDASDFANLTTNNTAIKLLGRQEGTDATLLGSAYADLLSASDIASLRTAGPGEFLGIFGNTVHHLRIQLTDQEQACLLTHA